MIRLEAHRLVTGYGNSEFKSEAGVTLQALGLTDTLNWPASLSLDQRVRSRFSGARSISTGSRLRLGLGGKDPGMDHGQLAVAGPANLAGVLGVSSLNGFVPAAGDVFDVVLYCSRSGAFGTITAPGFDPRRVSRGHGGPGRSLPSPSQPSGRRPAVPEPPQSARTPCRGTGWG